MRLRRPLALLTIAIFALGSSFCVAPPASAAELSPAPYTVTEIGVLPGGTESRASAINNEGVVAGYSDDALRGYAVRWANGTLTPAPDVLHGTSTEAFAINDAGDMAGQTTISDGGYAYPVRWDAAGGAVALGTPWGNALGHATGINNSRVVSGGQRPMGSSGSPQGGVYATDGHRTDFGIQYPIATGINDRGQVVGIGYAWQNNAVTALKGFGTGSVVETTAINIRGQIVGAAMTGAYTARPALWQSSTDQAPADLGQIGTNRWNVATAINAAGVVVGNSDPLCSPCDPLRPWIWSGGTLTALDQLLPAGSGWVPQTATGINDRGQIVGNGVHNGALRGFVLTPRVHININFQPAGARTPTGYVADTGAIFGNRNGLQYGWDTDDAAWMRDRNNAASLDQRYDTFAHLQKPGSARTWEIAVPNGTYRVHVVAGDPANFDSTFRLRVEGTVTAAGTPTPSSPWLEGTVTVTVADGRLTVGNALNSANNKINYIDIASV